MELSACQQRRRGHKASNDPHKVSQVPVCCLARSSSLSGERIWDSQRKGRFSSRLWRLSSLWPPSLSLRFQSVSLEESLEPTGERFFPFREETSAPTSEGEVWPGETAGYQGLAGAGQGQDGGAGGQPEQPGHQREHQRGHLQEQERRGDLNVEYPHHLLCLKVTSKFVI